MELVLQAPMPWRRRLNAWLETPLLQRSLIALILVNAVILGLETSSTVKAGCGPWLIAADKANIDLTFQRAAAIDLAGRDVLEAVRTSVNPKVIDCPDPPERRRHPGMDGGHPGFALHGDLPPGPPPGAGPPPGGDIRRIVVAFDGSSHAARALPVAAELAGRPGAACTLLDVASSEEAGREVLAPAEAFLSAHGLVPETRVAVSSRPSDVICDLVSRSGADLLIMGAFGHSPVREMLFGSTTERVLAHCPTSVVLQS